MPDEQLSTYLQYLPAIFQEVAGKEGVFFIGRFLLAFEKILTGLQDVAEPGLEEILEGTVSADGEILAGVHRYFDPGPGLPVKQRTPPGDFLKWLASWVALSLRGDWEEEETRRFISQVVPLYRKRGTKAGLTEGLRTYTGVGSFPGRLEAEVSEFLRPLQVGATATVGVDTFIDGGPPHYFQVRMFINDSQPDPDVYERKGQIDRAIRAIIDQEKPAHTYYDFHFELPTMQIAVHSTVGRDTLLG